MNDWPIYIGLPLWFWLFIFPTLIAAFCLTSRHMAHRILRPIWRILDRIYVVSGVIAAMFMVIILLLIVGQMVARWTNTIFPGAPNLQDMPWPARRLRWLCPDTRIAHSRFNFPKYE